MITSELHSDSGSVKKHCSGELLFVFDVAGKLGLSTAKCDIECVVCSDQLDQGSNGDMMIAHSRRD